MKNNHTGADTKSILNTKKKVKWLLPEGEVVDKSILLSKELNIDPLISTILLNRGINTKDAAHRFLYPSLKDMHNPFLMKGMQQAVTRVISSLKKKEKVCIYGDFDVDGITATSLLFLFLKEIGSAVSYYLPDRLSEGYGLRRETLLRLHKEEGITLVISVDCGITSVKEVKAANEVGLDIIITDHHQPPPLIPDACAVINPHQKDCPYPFKSLSGVGVVYKLIKAVRIRLRDDPQHADNLPNLLRHLDLVAMGSVADIVPVTGENRVFISFGLPEIEKTQKKGIRELKIVSGIANKPITTYDVGFLLSPRINAAGRIARPESGVLLLTSADRNESVKLANSLNQTNTKRKTMQDEIYGSAKEQISSDPAFHTKQAIVLSSPVWHPGIIGIVASKICEEFYKPTILIAFDGNRGRGSARSIPPFHIHEGLKKCSHLLVRFGGHKMAAGLTLLEKNLASFIAAFNDCACTDITTKDLLPEIKIDQIIQITDITRTWIESLKILEPYGEHNPMPVFLSKSVWIKYFSTMGKEKNHIKLVISDSTCEIEAIGFNMPSAAARFEKYNGPIDIVYSPKIHHFNGSSKIQLLIKDIQPAEEKGKG